MDLVEVDDAIERFEAFADGAPERRDREAVIFRMRALKRGLRLVSTAEEDVR